MVPCLYLFRFSVCTVLHKKIPRPNGLGMWWSILHSTRTFKSFAAQRYRVPVLSVKSSFPNHVHRVSERLQGNLPYRGSARKKHLASGRKRPMRHTPSQRLYILLHRDTAPYPVFPGRTRPLSILENFLPHGTASCWGVRCPKPCFIISIMTDQRRIYSNCQNLQVH